MSDQRARGHFRLGRELYEQGRFREAAQEFEVAYGMSGRSELLFNVYLAYRDAQDIQNAARALRGYLSAVPNAPDREHLTARLAALEAQLKAEADEAAAQRAQVERAQQEVDRARKERETAERRNAERRSAERRAAQRPSRPIWPWFVVGAGVAATAGGLVLGALATSDADDLRDACVLDPRIEGATAPLMKGTHCAPSVDLESRRDSIQTQATIADALWIGGAVITATGLVLAFVLPDEYPQEPLPVTAACSLDGCRGQFSFAF